MAKRLEAERSILLDATFNDIATACFIKHGSKVSVLPSESTQYSLLDFVARSSGVETHTGLLTLNFVVEMPLRQGPQI